MVWHAYELSPIDFGWDHLQTVTEVAEIFGSTEALWKLDPRTPCLMSVDEFVKAFDDAKDAAKHEGWEGDFRGSAYVFWLPSPDLNTWRPAFAWKQDNNGTTFVVSQFPLHHLRR